MASRCSALIDFSDTDTVTVTYPVSYKLAPIGAGAFAFVCDKQGVPQFYTNGGQIGNLLGDTLIASGMQENGVDQDYHGRLPIPQGAIVLPKNDCQYYCVYYSVSDSLYQFYQQADRLYYALVDMCANQGKGQVLSVKNVVYKGLMGDGRMTACKHANGRDWWLVTHGFNDSTYFKFLFSPDTVTGPFIQQIGASELEPDILGQAEFSSDGTKYVSITGGSPLVVLDFDRCTGEFSNPLNVKVSYFPPYQIMGSGGIGCVFSPSGRYVYVNVYEQIVQFDLWADTVENSMTLIAQYDTSYENSGPFHLAYLAPNNKIYIQTYQGGGRHYHVINNPDEKGGACNFVKEQLFVDFGSPHPISNMPHYRLGKVSGSACDTIISGIDEFATEDVLKVSPNPVKDKVEIQLAKYLPDADLQISDIQGRIVYQNKNYYLAEYITTHDWPAGVYFVRISNGKKEVKGKFVKE